MPWHQTTDSAVQLTLAAVWRHTSAAGSGRVSAAPGRQAPIRWTSRAPRRIALATGWSQEEVEATVADYFEMLSAELRGEAYSKAAHRRALLPLLHERSEGAIERKHGNISAVLIELGFPYIGGYKPFSNYQQLLVEVVSARLGSSPDLESLVAADVEAVPDAPTYDDILASLVDTPKPSTRRNRVNEPPDLPYRTRGNRPRINYLKRESANSALGAAGELFILDFERARLVAEGRERLAGDIEHVSATRGDGDGFDILSYEASGAERLIEVKTTKYASQTPFFVSANEVEVSKREAERYYLYRVFDFKKSPRFFNVCGAFHASFDLSPTQFLAKIA